jgi:hypothetical protein
MSGDLELIKYFEHLHEKKDTIVLCVYDEDLEDDVQEEYYIDCIEFEIFPSEKNSREDTTYFVNIYISKREDL